MNNDRLRELQQRRMEVGIESVRLDMEIRGESSITGHLADIGCACGGSVHFEFEAVVAMSKEDFAALRNFDAPSVDIQARGLATAVCEGCGARKRNVTR